MDYFAVVRTLLQNATARTDAEEWQTDAPLLGSVAELDSMAIVTFFTALEDEYGVYVEDDEVSAEIFETLGSLVEFVEAKLG